MFNLWNKIPVPFVHISLMKRYGKVEFITSKDSWSPSWFDLWLQNVCDTVDHEYVTFVVVKSSPFNVHNLLRIFYTSNTTVATSRAVTIYPSGASRFDYGFSSRLCIAQSIVFCVALCRPLVVISSFLPLYCLSFDLRLLINHEEATYHNCYQKLFRYITQLSIYNYIINDILCCNTITTTFKMLIEDIWNSDISIPTKNCVFQMRCFFLYYWGSSTVETWFEEWHSKSLMFADDNRCISVMDYIVTNTTHYRSSNGPQSSTTTDNHVDTLFVCCSNNSFSSITVSF